jgi:hypothetical protein
MRILGVSLLSLSVAASAAFAAALPKTHVQGSYIEARNADVYTAACFANSEVGLMGELAVFGWKIDKGSWEGVNVAGLSVVGVVKASGTLGDIHSTPYPVKSVLVIDEKANPEQRLALKNFAQHMGGDLLQDVVKVNYAPVDLEFANGNPHSRNATLKAGELASIQTRALNEGDQICHNEDVWYQPLTKLDHAMPAFTVANKYSGSDLNSTWSSPGKRSAFVGTFQYEN